MGKWKLDSVNSFISIPHLKPLSEVLRKCAWGHEVILDRNLLTHTAYDHGTLIFFGLVTSPVQLQFLSRSPGPDLDGKLTIERFLEFQNQLQREILRLEFDRKGPNAQGRITERQFAELLLAYADYSAKKRSAVLKRVKRAYKVRMLDNITKCTMHQNEIHMEGNND